MFTDFSRLATRLGGKPVKAPGRWSSRPKLEAPPRTEFAGSARQQLLDGFLRPGHGDLPALGQFHAQALDRDPLFYAPLSRWYQENGAMRDHQELFVAHLMCAPDPSLRAHATVLLQTLRPYQVARVVRYTKEVLHYATRALRSAVLFYLRRREADPAWFDEAVLRDRRSMKTLYASLHLRPDPRAEQVLFLERPPADSRVAVRRRLAALQRDPRAQAALIRQHHIHFTTATGAVKVLTPEILEALVEVMTPQQLLNHLALLERRGALQDPRFRALVRRKIADGVRESRVQDARSLVALSRIDPDPALASQLLALTQERLRRRGRITRPTALLVDKSGSMEACIHMGKVLACLASTVAAAPLWVEAFDSHSFPVRAEGTRLEDWHRAFHPIRADGATSVGAPLARLADQRIEQVVIVSDGEENTAPFFAHELLQYQVRHGLRPRVFFLKVSSHPETPLERDLRTVRADLVVLPFRGDAYNLPDVVPRLCSGDLVEEVLKCRLYTREDLTRLPPGFDPETCEIL